MEIDKTTIRLMIAEKRAHKKMSEKAQKGLEELLSNMIFYFDDYLSGCKNKSSIFITTDMEVTMRFDRGDIHSIRNETISASAALRLLECLKKMEPTLQWINEGMNPVT